MDLEVYPPIVVDNGSSTCRAGFAGHDAPVAVYSNVIGRLKHEIGLNPKNYIGDEAQNKRELLALTYPVEHGIVVNWDDMEKIWNHMFSSELKTLPSKHPVLISEPPLNPKGYREKLLQVMFETYQVPFFHLAFEPALCLMSAGRNCGTILNIGEGCTYVTSFYESFSPLQSVRRHDFGGKDLTRYLQHLLHKKGYSFTTSSEFETVREIKEQFCSMTPFKNSETCVSSLSTREEKFILPDGTSVAIGQERHTCPGLLFQPDGVFNTSGESITDMVHSSVLSCDFSCRRDIYSSVLLCGGSTFFPGFRERLHEELLEHGRWPVKGSVRVRVIDSPERKYHVWIGGSILASLATFTESWITKEDYEESGPQILLRKGV